MTINLDFELNCSNEYVAEHGGFTVKIVQDQSPSNPFEDGDGEPTIAIAYGREGITIYGDSDILDPLRFLSDGKLARHQSAIAKALDVEPGTIHSEALDIRRNYGGRLVDIKREAFNDILGDMANGNKADYLSAIAALFTLTGIEALDSCSTGYSQGDYADVLAVALPSWAARVGAPRKSHASQLAYAVKLYGYWAWGDCYGYVIEDSEGEHVDSCFGFYSDDIDGAGFKLSGMADYCLSALESAIEERDETFRTQA